ncbi:MAG: response regulator transcription factor [Sedimentisphaerales bacterium]|nr:response regulator transcription factor [Sedimentisphaerales bacterium]
MELQVHVLVVEDDQGIRTALVDFLEYHGFRVTPACDGLSARQAVERERFDLILLDLMLPEIGGEQLCSLWRRGGVQTPIIMVTAKGQEKDRIQGLELGADDYITKPFSLEEMLARIRAVLRRTDPGRGVGQAFVFGDLLIDMAALKAQRGDHKIDLTRREALIVQYFAANPNRVIDREELYREVWRDILTDLGTRTVDMHIAKLRAKIELNVASPQIIQTVRGAGYKYAASV